MELTETYRKMQDEFVSEGLDVPFIVNLRSSYTLNAEGEPEPLSYAQLNPSLPPNTQRLVVFPLDSASELLQQAVQATEDVLYTALPPGITAYLNHPSRLHVTIFYLSHVDDPRTEPHTASGGVSDAHLTPDRLQEEESWLQKAVASFPPFSLQVDRLLLAPSGTLLLCLTDPSGRMQAFREHMRDAFPGAPGRQTQIIHTSLLRILSPQQLDQATREAVQARCDDWTKRLKGRQIPCQAMWYIQETMYANIEGRRSTISLKLAG